MALLCYVIKIKEVLFSKLTYCVYQKTFFFIMCPAKRRALFEKDMLEKRCTVVKSYWRRMETKYYLLRKLSCHTMQNIKVFKKK